jgi:hypothetical protein
MIKKLLAFIIFTTAVAMVLYGFVGHQEQVKVFAGPNNQHQYNDTLNEPGLITAIHTNSLIGKQQAPQRSSDLYIDRSGACAS